MKILDLQTGEIHEYGTNGHDSLAVSQDGRTLSYYNLQCGDGSRFGDYRFVCDDDKVPEESQTADALHCEVYFNIGGWSGERKKGEWEDSHIYSCGKILKGRNDVIEHKCSVCKRWSIKWDGTIPDNYCSHCGADMRGEDNG